MPRGLSEGVAESLFTSVFAGALNDSAIAALLSDMHTRGETVAEIVGVAKAAWKLRVPFALHDPHAIDTCGTGGDGLNTFNVSSAVALAAAAMGITVIKHGNRAASSRCGSADVLEALGIDLERDETSWQEALRTQHFAFLYAPAYHPSFKRVAPVRKALGHRTIFNLLGPLINPAGVERQVLGVYDRKWVEPMAEVLVRLGRKRALVVHGGIGSGPTDELAPWGRSLIASIDDGEIHVEERDLSRVGAVPADVQGSDAAHNAALIRAVLQGRGTATAHELVALNLAAALYVAGRSARFDAQLEQARDFLASGRGARHWNF